MKRKKVALQKDNPGIHRRNNRSEGKLNYYL